MACCLLPSSFAVSENPRGTRLQYTIEAKELTNRYSQRPSYEAESRRTVVEAIDADAAISQFVRDSKAELVSLTRPARGTESIVTMKKEDAVFLVRVYAA